MMEWWMLGSVCVYKGAIFIWSYFGRGIHSITINCVTDTVGTAIY